MYQDYCDDKTGARAIRLRRQRNPNRRAFVRAIPGMSEKDLRQIERSERPPRLEELLLLAHFLETSVEHLAKGRGPNRLGPEERKYILLFLGTSRQKIHEDLAKERQ